MSYQGAKENLKLLGNKTSIEHANKANGELPLTEEDPAVEHQRFLLGIAYMMAMGVCGIILVAIGSNLKQLADNCNTTTTHIGTVFIVRGVGAIFGAVVSAKVYRFAPGNRVMMVTLLFLSLLVMVLPVVGDIYTMHVVFGLLGMCTAVTDTGCQIQTRKVHGAKAGPWLGVNTVVFSISGAFVPLIALATDSLFAQCGILAGVTFVSALLLCVPKAPEALPPPGQAFAPKHAPRRVAPQDDDDDDKALLGGATAASSSGEDTVAEGLKLKEAGLSSSLELKAVPEKKSFAYIVELLAGFEALWLIGGKVAATSYFTTYVDYTGVIPSKQSGLLIVLLWVGISLGRVVGIFDQLGLPTERLYRHVYLQLWLGAGGMLAVLVWPSSGVALWTGVLVYGFFNGPTIGYVYDLCNRTTAASEKGMSECFCSAVGHRASVGGGGRGQPFFLFLAPVLPTSYSVEKSTPLHLFPAFTFYGICSKKRKRTSQVIFQNFRKRIRYF